MKPAHARSKHTSESVGSSTAGLKPFSILSHNLVALTARTQKRSNAKVNKILAVCAVLLFLLLFPVIIGWWTPFTPPAPESWHQIHAGMSRSNILQIAGPAPIGMYPEKILEGWYRDGALGLRRFEVIYDHEGKAKIVQEYIYWRPSQRYIEIRTERTNESTSH